MIAFVVAFFAGLLALMTVFFLMAFAVTAWPALAILSLWLLARDWMRYRNSRLVSGC